MIRALPRLVARIPATVHTKLLVAFLTIAGLLIALGAVGLEVLGEVNRRSEDLVKLQRKIAAYRQLQHDTTAQLYSVASALLMPEERSLENILRQLNQFGYDLDRLQFVARDEVELLGRVRADYDEFIGVVTRVVELIRHGRGAEGRGVQLAEASPLADRLERLTNQLVNQAEADMVASVDTSHAAFVRARWAVPGIDGVEALRRLRTEETTRGIPVMAMTASVMSEDRQKIMAAGFDAYQSKPLNVTEFVAAVAQLLERGPT